MRIGYTVSGGKPLGASSPLTAACEVCAAVSLFFFSVFISVS